MKGNRGEAMTRKPLRLRGKRSAIPAPAAQVRVAEEFKEDGEYGANADERMRASYLTVRKQPQGFGPFVFTDRDLRPS
jgi:hypothetical protein